MRTAALGSMLALTLLSSPAAGPKFYPDDPIARDPESQDASGAQEIDVSQQYDFVENTFLGAGDRQPVRAMNINTIGEVPDSSWFTNRAGTPGWSPATVTLEPAGAGPAQGSWTIVSAKTEGITPGLSIRDSAGVLFFIKFDPRSNPEMASSAEIISTKLFHAFGYHVPENHLATLRREALTIAPGTTVTDVDGRRHPMRPRDIDDLLEKAARGADGTYRVLASKALAGKPVGHFRYHGTRPDDPNDIFPHEHRRELRGLSVFAAWLNHDDSRSVNSLDTLVSAGGRSIIRHHLIDFGSTLGSGSTQAQTTRAGNEYIWESRPTFVTMLTLGFYVRPWVKVEYPNLPSVGRFEGDYFQPDAWKPEYPNPAFRNARPDDRFWAARIVAAIPDDTVRQVVAAAKLSDAPAAEYLASTLILRKQKVLQAWLNGTNPIVEPALSAAGVLTFQNAAARAGVGPTADHYSVTWSRFDNAAASHQPAGDEATVSEPRAQAPAALLSSNAEYIAVRLRAFHADRPAWSQPLTAYFRRAATGWTLAGLDRGE